MSARRKFCSGGNSKMAPHKYKKGLPHAEKLAKNILLKYSYIFASEKVLRKCNPKRTKVHNKQTFWGVCSNVPLNIVRSNTVSLIFIKMNIFTIFFLQNCSKIHSRTHQIAQFKKKISREHAPKPPSIQVASPRTLCMAQNAMQIGSLFHKLT